MSDEEADCGLCVLTCPDQCPTFGSVYRRRWSRPHSMYAYYLACYIDAGMQWCLITGCSRGCCLDSRIASEGADKGELTFSLRNASSGMSLWKCHQADMSEVFPYHGDVA
jgi:hypothetical protein